MQQQLIFTTPSTCAYSRKGRYSISTPKCLTCSVPYSPSTLFNIRDTIFFMRATIRYARIECPTESKKSALKIFHLFSLWKAEHYSLYFFYSKGEENSKTPWVDDFWLLAYRTLHEVRVKTIEIAENWLNLFILVFFFVNGLFANCLHHPKENKNYPLNVVAKGIHICGLKKIMTMNVQTVAFWRLNSKLSRYLTSEKYLNVFELLHFYCIL